MAVERDVAASPARIGIGWVILLVITVLAGLVAPPLGVVLAAIGAVRAHAEGKPGLRNAFVALAAVFAVMTVFFGVFLVGVQGGGSVTPTT